jgi:hypothetical protein
VTRTQTIGRYYATTAGYINDPISEWYISPADSSMDCGTLQKMYQLCASYITYWNGVLRSANSTEAGNISKILLALNAKLNDYAQLVTVSCKTTYSTGSDVPVSTIPPVEYEQPAVTAPAAPKNNLLLYAGIAALVIFRKQLFH